MKLIPEQFPRWAETLSSGLEVASPGFVELRANSLVALEHFAKPRPEPHVSDRRADDLELR